MTEHRELIAEGKTKKIWRESGTVSEVLIESKDDITAGDGVRRDRFDGKGAYSNETAINCFMLLNRHGIPNHFLKWVNERTFCARWLEMIPIEIVARRIATGSYLKREPRVEEGTHFPEPVIEFFDKDDAMHDPLLVYDFVRCRIIYFDAKRPLRDGFIKESRMEHRERSLTMTTRLVDLVGHTFRVLEAAWATQNVTLVDLKIECGQDKMDGKIMVGDVITNDEWRIWPGGQKSQQLDKQIFREMDHAAKGDMAKIKANYARVAKMTRLFLH